MNLQEKFDQELFNLINLYENRYNISVDKIELKKEKDTLGEKVVEVQSSFKELEVKQQSETKKMNFFTHVLLPTVLLFIFFSIILELINN